MKKSGIFGIMMCLFLSAGWSAEFNGASYTQTTLQDILTEEQNHSSDRAEARQHADCIQLEYKVSKYRVSCCYTSIRRPISEKKKNVIRLWMETLSIDPVLTSLYRHEIQVTDGAKVHWIPIQEQLFPYINQELARNDKVDLFLIFIGKVSSEFVFIATEFEKPISAAGNSVQATACTRVAP
jgi:hypothetical protein